MDNLSRRAQPNIGYLLQAEPDELYEELGLRLEAIKRNPSLAGYFDFPEQPRKEALGLVDVERDLRTFGEKFFERINVEAYTLVCGKESEETEERKNLQNAFGLGREAVAASIAALLVAQLGLAPAVAAVVAALIIRLVFQSAHSAMCEVWSTKVETNS